MKNKLSFSKNKKNKKNSKKACTDLDYTEHVLLLVPMVTGCVSISTFAYLVGIPAGIVFSAVGLQISAITARNKNISQ